MREAYTRGAYTWNNTSVKENVGLSAEGLIGGEIPYTFTPSYV